MDTRRLVLFVIFSMSILMLWDAWQRQTCTSEVVAQQASQAVVDGSVPNQAASAAATNANGAVDGEL